MSEQQDTTKNQDQITNIPEPIIHGIENHFTKEFLSSDKILLVDLETKKPELYTELSQKIARMLLGENFSEYEGLPEIVNEISDNYPTNKIFLLTTLEHIKKHYLLEALTKLNEKAEKIDEYENTIRGYRIQYRIYVNRTVPKVVGVMSWVATLKDDKLIETLMRSVAAAELEEIDEEKYVGWPAKFAVFNKKWFIYQNQPVTKYLLTDVTGGKETETADYTLKIEWFAFVETTRLTLRESLDP